MSRQVAAVESLRSSIRCAPHADTTLAEISAVVGERCGRSDIAASALWEICPVVYAMLPLGGAALALYAMVTLLHTL